MTMIILITIYLLIILVAAVHLPESNISLAELRRRAGRSASAQLRYDRERLRPQVLALRQTVVTLLLIAFALYGSWSNGWTRGAWLALAAVLSYRQFARIAVIRRMVGGWYVRAEPTVLTFVQRWRRAFDLVADDAHPVHRPIASREELRHALYSTRANDVSADLLARIDSLVVSDTMTVEQVMTPRDDVVAVSDDEVLGPLVLDDLYKSGRSRFPVYRDSLDQIVGVLPIGELLTLRHKKSARARSAMDAGVEYAAADDRLDAAVARLIASPHQLLVVIDDERHTLGILTLEAALSAMFGDTLSAGD